MRDIRRGGHRALCRTISELVDFMYVDAKQLIDDAVRVGIFPAAVIEVGDTSGCQWTYAAGTIAHGDVSVDTVFDLASLTKVIDLFVNWSMPGIRMIVQWSRHEIS